MRKPGLELAGVRAAAAGHVARPGGHEIGQRLAAARRRARQGAGCADDAGDRPAHRGGGPSCRRILPVDGAVVGQGCGAREGLETNGQYYLGARAGFALTPGIAAYGKVGYTSLDTTAFTSSGSLSDLEENTDGVRYGAGVQIDLPSALEARIEYRRSQYNDLADIDQGEATTDQIVAGIGLRF